MSKRQTIKGLHCQACGGTSAENVGHDALRRNDGYTACCNERAVSPTEQSWDYLGRLVEMPVPCDRSDDCYHA